MSHLFRFTRQKLFCFLGFVLCVHSIFSVESSLPKASQNIEDFQAEKRVDQLLLLIQKRLAIMHEVAKTKWNQHLPIEDKAREERILVDLAQKASQYNLDEKWIAQFFQTQIDAAKKVQINDFSLWQSQGIVKFTEVLSLQKDLRHYIDQINEEMISLLSELHGDIQNLDRFVLEQPISIKQIDHIDDDIWLLAISSMKAHKLKSDTNDQK